MISANGGLLAHRYTPQVTQRWPRGSEAATEPENVPDLMFVEPEELEVAEVEEDPPATSSSSDLEPPAAPAPRLSWAAPLKMPPGMEKKVPYMGDVWVTGTRLGTAAISLCSFTTEGLAPGDENAEQWSMSWYHRCWILLPMEGTMVRVPVAPGCVYFGFCPSSPVLFRSASALRCSEHEWRCFIPPQSTACKPSLTAK